MARRNGGAERSVVRRGAGGRRGPAWGAALLAILGVCGGCGGDDGGGVSFRVTELRMVRCAGTYNGSMLRLVAVNAGGGAVNVLRVEVGADPTAELGDVRATLTAAPELTLGGGVETPLVCSGGLPGAFSPMWNPPTVPVNVALVYGTAAAEQRVFVPAEIVIEYNAATCPNIPVEPCRIDE
jgi:hypothetical protein